MEKLKIADAETFQPFTLDKNAGKQIWLTVTAPENAEGLYKGEIKVSLDGKAAASIPVALRVLPFALPEPMTHYDITRKYHTSSYTSARLDVYLKENGDDKAAAEKRLLAVYKNYKNHNVMNPMVQTAREGNDELFRRQLEIYKQAGLDTSTVFDAIRRNPRLRIPHKPRRKKTPCRTGTFRHTGQRKSSPERNSSRKSSAKTQPSTLSDGTNPEWESLKSAEKNRGSSSTTTV